MAQHERNRVTWLHFYHSATLLIRTFESYWMIWHSRNGVTWRSRYEWFYCECKSIPGCVFFCFLFLLCSGLLLVEWSIDWYGSMGEMVFFSYFSSLFSRTTKIGKWLWHAWCNRRQRITCSVSFWVPLTLTFPGSFSHLSISAIEF